MNEKWFEGRSFLAENQEVSHVVMFCHDASPQRQQKPAGSRTEKVAIGYSFRSDKVRMLLIKLREKNCNTVGMLMQLENKVFTCEDVTPKTDS